jgi:hypothetical protein
MFFSSPATEFGDQYCFCCEDGGDLIDCDNLACHRAYCYDEVGATQDENIQDGAPACITIAPGQAQDKLWFFRCPECMLDDPTQTIDVSGLTKISNTLQN